MTNDTIIQQIGHTKEVRGRYVNAGHAKDPTDLLKA